MSYGTADTNPKVGYRPYHHSSPRRAASLSGLDGEAAWKLGQVRAFDPWILHKDTAGYARGLHGDLGQVRPFDQHPGGWVLHGIGQVDFLQAGTRIEYAAEYKGDLVAGGLTPTDAVGNLEQFLPSKWNITVESGHGSRDFVGKTSIAVKVLLNADYGNAEDIRSIIDGELYAMGIGQIYGSRIVAVTPPGGSRTRTGADEPTTPTSDIGAWLQNNALLIGALVGAIIILPPLLSRR